MRASRFVNGHTAIRKMTPLVIRIDRRTDVGFSELPSMDWAIDGLAGVGWED